MFTGLRNVIDNIVDLIGRINELLLQINNDALYKINTLPITEHNSIFQDFEVLEFITAEIDPVDSMLSKINSILDAVENYLERLIDRVPHYDEVTPRDNYLSDLPDEGNDDEFDEDQPYEQEYYNTVLEKVTLEELEDYTHDNGKIVHACRAFIPPATAQLNVLSTMFENLEMMLSADELNHRDVQMCAGNINQFATHFTAFLNGLNM